MSYKGCPKECKCSYLSSRKDNIFSVKCNPKNQLSKVPSQLPEETGALFLGNNRISFLLKTDFTLVAATLQYLDIARNVLISIQRETFVNLHNLKSLRLNSNFLRTLQMQTFVSCKSLEVLDLSENLLKDINVEIFSSLKSLKVLSLRGNEISTLPSSLFANNGNISALYLDHNTIQDIPDGLFSSLKKLKILYLNYNKIKAFTSKTFEGLASIETLYLQGNSPTSFPPGLFEELRTLKHLKLDDFFLCCHASKAIPRVHCESPREHFSSCSDLMKNKTLQVFIWILGLSALLGNLMVIVLRVTDKDDKTVNSFLLTNLASADLIMGVYMLIIAAKDVQFQGEYFKHDYFWRNGFLCGIAGALSMLSSEASVFLLTLITADRFKNIVFPFSGQKLLHQRARIICILIWSVCIVMSVIPMFNVEYFYDSTRRVGYYGRSALCLPVQLTKDKLAGWEYSVIIFIAINLISFLFILCAYITMFIKVAHSSRSVRSTSANKESQLAKRIAFIVATDFCCWVPVIIIGILSLVGWFHDPEGVAYAWLAVFVIPVNSSINPILYTFSTTQFCKRILESNLFSSLVTSSSSPNSNSGNAAGVINEGVCVKEMVRKENEHPVQTPSNDTQDTRL